MNKPLVIYHDSCTDGFGAAFAAWLKLGDDAEYLPMQYGYKELPNFDGRTVFILDFSLRDEDMEQLFSVAEKVVWLDHHRTAFEMWCETEREWHEDQTGDLGDHYILLDNNKSGAYLAWEYFHPGTEVPLLIQHIDDRDRWQFKLEGSKELHAALASYKPWSFEQWKRDFLPADMGKTMLSFEATARYSELMKIGAAILRAQDAAVAQAVKNARKCCIRLYDPAHDLWQRAEYGPEEFSGLAVSCPLHQSEIGHELANLSGTYGLVWYMKEDGSIICSLRSNGDYDVSAIAKAFGGGGHKNAAGFQTDLQVLRGWLK